MGRVLAIGIAVLVVLAPVTAASAIGVVPPTVDDGFSPLASPPEATDAPDETPPGAQFAGVIGAHEADHDGAVATHRVAVRIERGATAVERAAILARIYNETRDRLDRLATRRATLETAVANGSMPVGEYRARSAELTVELRAVERIAASLVDVGQSLSLTVLIDVGVDLTDLRALEARAASLQGSVLPTVAPSFAVTDGGTTGDGDGGSTDDNETVAETTNVTAVIEDAQATVDRADDRVGEATTLLEGMVLAPATATLLEQAQANLTAATDRLASARAAQAAGDDAAAVRLARAAIDHADLAIEYAQRAVEAATTT